MNSQIYGRMIKIVRCKMFPIRLPIGLIVPIKSRPHFIKGSSRNVVTNLATFFVFSPLIF
jgi:hypothetical protein